MPSAIRPTKPVRLAADVDGSTAEQFDRLAQKFDVPRAELLREMVRQGLKHQ